MNDMKPQKTQPGSPALTHSPQQTWVQTEREAHEAWGNLISSHPSAAALMHKLVAHMDKNAVIVASHATLARICGYSTSTLKRAILELKARQWIEVLQIGGKGGACAYVVNSRVAWADSREKLPMAIFTARVIVSADEQTNIEKTPLRRIPVLMNREELQLPTGPGQEPPAQPAISGLEPDLPAIVELETKLPAIKNKGGQ